MLEKIGLNTPPCGTAAERGVIVPILQVSGLEQVGQQPQEAVVVEFLAQDRQQDRVVQTVETLVDIALDEPLDPSPVLGDLPQGGVTTSTGAEPVGVRAELRLVVRFQKGADDFLQQFIRPSGNPERT